VTPTHRSRDTSTGSPDPASSFIACKIISRSTLRFAFSFWTSMFCVQRVGVVGKEKKSYVAQKGEVLLSSRTLQSDYCAVALRWRGQIGNWSVLVRPMLLIIEQFCYTECPRRNVPDFGRVFLMLKYTDITQNTYVQSWTVTEIMAREKCGLLVGPRTVPVSWHTYPCPSLSVVSYYGNSAVKQVLYFSTVM